MFMGPGINFVLCILRRLTSMCMRVFVCLRGLAIVSVCLCRCVPQGLAAVSECMCVYGCAPRRPDRHVSVCGSGA